MNHRLKPGYPILLKQFLIELRVLRSQRITLPHLGNGLDLTVSSILPVDRLCERMISCPPDSNSLSS